MAVQETPVLVVGAGLGGLSTAVFLGAHGVPALVVDRHSGTSTQPKARGQNPTVMEALGSVGLTDRILAATPPGRPGMTGVIADSVTGTVIRDLSEESPDFSRYSPAPHGMASQEAAEAALAARAVELGAKLSFATSCEGLDQDADGVAVTLRDIQTGAVQTVRASYVVAADGHRGGLRDAVGITSHGRGTYEDATTTWRIRADLSELVPDTAVVVYYLQNPSLPGRVGMIISTDNPGEWVAGMIHDPDRTTAETIELVRRMVGVADLDVELLGSATWQVAHRVADSFRAGRVLLVGDTAHVMPPTGGQGGNLAVLDGYHLGWKLAAVVRGQAGAALLDSHDAEQRPFAQAVADWQVANIGVRLRPDQADSSIGEPMDGARLLFGYRASDGAFVAEPGPRAGELFVDPASTSGLPGMRVPHVALHRNGIPVSPRALLGAHFLLLTGAAKMTLAAPGIFAALGLQAVVHKVGPTGSWTRAAPGPRRPAWGPPGQFSSAPTVSSPGAPPDRPAPASWTRRCEQCWRAEPERARPLSPEPAVSDRGALDGVSDVAEAEHVLDGAQHRVVVDRLSVAPWPDHLPGHEERDAVGRGVVLRLVPGDHQQALVSGSPAPVAVQRGAKPCVAVRKGTVMHVVAEVRDHERHLRQRGVVRPERGEWLGEPAREVAEVGHRIVLAGVLGAAAYRVARRR